MEKGNSFSMQLLEMLSQQLLQKDWILQPFWIMEERPATLPCEK
jgi:hypothetical protein